MAGETNPHVIGNCWCGWRHIQGTWRVGRKVPRNLYRGEEPIAMLASTALAAEIAAKLNAAESALDLASQMQSEKERSGSYGE